MKSSFNLRFETLEASYDAAGCGLKIRAAGDWKSTTVAAVQRDLLKAMESDGVKLAAIGLLELDLSAAAVVDSQGLNLLVTVLKQMKLRGVPVRTKVARRAVYLTLLSVGMDRQMEVVFEEGLAAA
ncbi:MAG: STAS domain-containing protein [Verrucomicrobiae bacterium]